ncbi:MAG: YfhO family protein [Clostridiales bacterium]|jgi:hypothetical protein|nr:YfhO family protein [Clostridiales bacterium]
MNKLFTFLIVLFPVFSIYGSFLPGVDFGTFCLIGLTPFLLFQLIKRKGRVSFPAFLMLLLIYSVVLTLIRLFMGTPMNTTSFSILMRMFRFVYVLGVVFIGYRSFFDFSFGIRLLRWVTILATTYLLIQSVVFSLTGFVLPSFIPGITKLEGLTVSTTLSQYAEFYRPPSFFAEPSSYVYFVTLFLTYCLFSGDGYFSFQQRIVTAVYITIGVLVSTSGQGMLVITVLWLVYFMRLLFQKAEGSRKVANLLIVLLIAVAVLPFLFRSTLVENTLGRVFSPDDGMSAIDARDGGYEMFFRLPLLDQIFGMGFGNLPDSIYFSSIADIGYTMGFVGLFLVLLLYLTIFRRGCFYQRMLCISSVLLMLGGGLFTATYLALYLSFMFYRNASEAPAEVPAESKAQRERRQSQFIRQR